MKNKDLREKIHALPLVNAPETLHDRVETMFALPPHIPSVKRRSPPLFQVLSAAGVVVLIAFVSVFLFQNQAVDISESEFSLTSEQSNVFNASAGSKDVFQWENTKVTFHSFSQE